MPKMQHDTMHARHVHCRWEAHECLRDARPCSARADPYGNVDAGAYRRVMHMESRRWTGAGVEVVPGARSRHFSNLEKLTFAFWAVCDSVGPDVWHGEVWFGSQRLLVTEPANDENAAGRLAENALESKIVALFADN